MKCLNPFCEYPKTRVINSRKTEQGKKILRRRHCLKCNKRYTSIEVLAYLGYPNAQKRASLNLLLMTHSDCLGVLQTKQAYIPGDC
jgi:transcriptional repressor NrdR